MARLGELDLPDRFSRYWPGWLTQILFAVLCAGATILCRIALDTIAPGAGVFALLYPAVMMAALFAGYQAGLITLLILILYLWFFILSPVHSFLFSNPADAARTAVNFAAGLAVVLLADLFRRAVRRGVQERNAQLVARDLFLLEIDHRVKNNFAMVSSLLEMQRRRAADAPTKDALATALNRVQSIARAHHHLYRDKRETGTIDMKVYLGELCQALTQSLFLQGGVVLSYASDSAELPRDRAVSIGLIVNELVTNAAKHAFEGREKGAITVNFGRSDQGWRLTVKDDGKGLPERNENMDLGKGGLGHRLIEAFSSQAHGVLRSESGPQGACFILELSP